MESNPTRIRGAADVLSSLPDSLLLEIISRLPIKSAVSTSLLSHRWTHLWTHLTRLYFSFSKTQHDDLTTTFPTLPNLITAVDHTLSHLATSKLHCIQIHVSDPPHDDVDSFLTRLGSWVPDICARNPDTLAVSVSSPGKELFIDLPTCIFATKSFIFVSLDGIQCIPNDGVGDISLPNLRLLRLELILRDLDCESMEILFKSCPQLEYLYLKLHLVEGKNECVLDISAPNLSHLGVNLCTPTRGLKFVIDAPKLEMLTLRGHLAMYEFVESPRELLDAVVGFSSFLPLTAKQNVSCLLRGISCVISLMLLDCTIAIFNSVKYGRDDVLPVFHQLVRLKIVGISKDDMSWCPTVPGFLLTKVKRVELPNLKCNKDEMKLISCILDHANVLEKLKIVVFCNKSKQGKKEQLIQLWKECNFCRELNKLRPSSKSIKIKFVGRCVSASGDGKGNGLLCNFTL